MITQDQLRTVIGATAYDRDGDKLGKIGHVYYDDNTDEPKWLTVNTGFFGTSENFVPIQGAEVGDDRVTVGFDKATVKDAPNVEEDGHLTPDDEERLYRHYSLDYGSVPGTGDTRTGDTRTGDTRTGDDVTTGTATGLTGRHSDRSDADVDRDGVRDGVRDTDLDGLRDDDVSGRTRSHDTSGPTTDEAMTRSEERLNVGTETREAGRARLRKHVVTEQQEVSVPVSREEVRVEREPITDANRGDAYDGPSISEEEHELVLREERPVVDTEAVAVERVRLGAETVRETETVGGEVRKEEIEVDDDGARTARTDRDDRR